MTRISRRDALRVAADVLDRSDWLLVDRLAEGGDEHASENADRVVEILREEVDRLERGGEVVVVTVPDPFIYPPRVPATVPPPSGATGAPTYATGGYVGTTVTRPVSNGGPRTSGPLDPEIHAALVRSVEGGRLRDDICRLPDCYCDGKSHP